MKKTYFYLGLFLITFVHFSVYADVHTKKGKPIYSKEGVKLKYFQQPVGKVESSECNARRPKKDPDTVKRDK